MSAVPWEVSMGNPEYRALYEMYIKSSREEREREWPTHGPFVFSERESAVRAAEDEMDQVVGEMKQRIQWATPQK